MSKKSGTQRQGKRALRREQVAREKRMKAIRTWGPIGVVVIGLIIFTLIRVLNVEEVEGATAVAAAQSNQHDPDLQIPFGGLPPTGGPHNPTWQNCGIYDTPVTAEYAIHSMEHGAVWVTYNPELAADQIAQLQEIARGDAYLLLSPYPDQSENIVLTVWDRQLTIDNSDDARIEDFIDAYRRQRGPEPAASCDRGVGSPIG